MVGKTVLHVFLLRPLFSASEISESQSPSSTEADSSMSASQSDTGSPLLKLRPPLAQTFLILFG